MCGVSRKDKCKNSDVTERCSLKQDVLTRIERDISRSFGHRERMNGSRLIKEIHRANVCDSKDGKDRPRKSYDFQFYSSPDLVIGAQDRTRLKRYLPTAPLLLSGISRGRARVITLAYSLDNNTWTALFCIEDESGRFCDKECSSLKKLAKSMSGHNHYRVPKPLLQRNALQMKKRAEPTLDVVTALMTFNMSPQQPYAHWIESAKKASAHTNKPSRLNHTGKGILDLTIITGLLKEEINTFCRQLDSISSDHLPWLFTTDLKIKATKLKARNFRKMYKNKESIKIFIRAVNNKIDFIIRISANQKCEDFIEMLKTAIIIAVCNQRSERALIIAPRPIKRTKQQRIPVTGNTSSNGIKKPCQNNSKENERMGDRQKHITTKLLTQHKEEKWLEIIESKSNFRDKLWSIQRFLKKSRRNS
ncbi:hypothetical protein EVAR_34419_1 [Eumeta japonica]|uniref:Uncharacterized protein n=1 Tax=Eumeta variegata TaxID=151549 RepID=A0A4C1WKI2_EUMVA|nr:hypothetical protein EVAR_34419_1 [Eumeta japonica]